MDAYGHLRVLVSLILGLSITRVLSGLSRRLQEPGKTDRMHAKIVWSMALLLWRRPFLVVGVRASPGRDMEFLDLHFRACQRFVVFPDVDAALPRPSSGPW